MSADLHGVLPRLRKALSNAHYAGAFDAKALTKGDPAGFLPLLHWVLLEYSHPVALWLAEVGSGLSPAMSDARFVETAQRVLRDRFAYRSSLNVHQLLQPSGFAERKMLLVLDTLQLCKTKHDELVGREKRRAPIASPRTTPRVAAGEVARSPLSTVRYQMPARPLVISSEQRVAPPPPMQEAMSFMESPRADAISFMESPRMQIPGWPPVL